MANELTPSSKPSLTPCARRLLADNAGWEDGLPTRWEPPRSMTPMEREAATEAAASLKAMLQPATRDQFDQAMMRLRIHGAAGPGEKALGFVIDDYRRLLGDTPPDILAAAVDQHIKASPYWPKVADLNAIIAPQLEERKRMLARAERLANEPERGNVRYYGAAPQRRPQLSQDERKRIADGFKSAAETLRNMPGPGEAV